MRLIDNKRELLARYPTCYACSEACTSMEHTPPQCFFPEDKDHKGNYLFRKNPIKVPSCDRHNTKKSNDDVYALCHLATLHGVNSMGEKIIDNVFSRLVDHDCSKRGGRFVKRLLAEVSEFDYSGRPVGHCDGQRMQRFLAACARAVYFYETFTKLLLPLKVTNIGNDFRNSTHTESLHEREKFFDSEIGNANILGAELDVFNYSIKVKNDMEYVLIRLVFYGTLKHWVYYYPELSYRHGF